MIIRGKPMLYTRQDIDEFENQINELLSIGLIEKTSCFHSSLPFTVRNFNKMKRKNPEW